MSRLEREKTRESESADRSVGRVLRKRRKRAGRSTAQVNQRYYSLHYELLGLRHD